MTGLYRRLFVYRERQNRSPLEDFLTEALADLLNRLPDAMARDAAERLLAGRPDIIQELKRVWPPGAIARWTTQKGIDGGRIIDLVMEVDDRPVIVVENKISAGFQKHALDAQPAVDGTSQHQLATYGQWLARETDPAWGGALVLLTHWTPPPPDFATGGVYACRYRTTARWADFSRWLRDVSRTGPVPATDWSTLAGELASFLRGQNMDSELATGQDWAALQLYIKSADRVRNSIRQIWNGSKLILGPPLCRKSDKPHEVSTEYGCVWKYQYLARPDSPDTYIAIGVRYPDLTDHLSKFADDGGPYLFVELASEREDLPRDKFKMPPEGWQYDKAAWLAKRPVRTLPVPAEHFIKEGEDWARERVKELAEALA